MTNQEIIINFKSYNRGLELDNLQRKTLEAAQQATQLAYAPFSNFFVGAALLLENETIILGCNQENASYPCGICAERAALFSYGNLIESIPIKKLAVNVRNQKHHHPVAPCGLCRQVISEFELKNNQPIEIILGDLNNNTYVFKSSLDLLPLQFHSGFLK
ncbi:MAG: cytidine deaminase [Saprospiraceae bacterium]|nr:cytidine deaminase [Saprospiraceae bacterium]MBK9221500.1 cytidine deaminase [Saprospiraceae bacterium]MBK9721562.1 cytidine deaminase [Saprospiraceae bacterium]